MITDSDIAVVHIGTNDALGKSGDNDCLAQCRDSIDKIHQSTTLPMLVCSVPPPRSMHCQRRMNKINSPVRYKCSMDNKLCFVSTKLTASDIGGDGIHLTDTGKDKLASSIHHATHQRRYMKTSNSTVVDSSYALLKICCHETIFTSSADDSSQMTGKLSISSKRFGNQEMSSQIDQTYIFPFVKKGLRLANHNINRLVNKLHRLIFFFFDCDTPSLDIYCINETF